MIADSILHRIETRPFRLLSLVFVNFGFSVRRCLRGSHDHKKLFPLGGTRPSSPSRSPAAPPDGTEKLKFRSKKRRSCPYSMDNAPLTPWTTPTRTASHIAMSWSRSSCQVSSFIKLKVFNLEAIKY